MLENIEERVYTRLPERLQPVAQKWYYIVNPYLSWDYRKKPVEVDESFIDRFFEDESEFNQYSQEFIQSDVNDICMRAERSLPDGYTIFDAHRKDCLKYYTLVRKRKPSVLVETGVYSGVTTLSLLLALEQNETGTLHSIDFSSHLRDPGGADVSNRREYYERNRPSCSEPGSSRLPPGKEPGWIVPDRLEPYWSFIEGSSARELPLLLSDLDHIDFFVHDSEHSTARMLFEFELAWEWLTPGGMILSSHIQWNDAFETFTTEHDCEHGLSTFHYLGYEGEKIPCSTGYIIKR